MRLLLFSILMMGNADRLLVDVGDEKKHHHLRRERSGFLFPNEEEFWVLADKKNDLHHDEKSDFLFPDDEIFWIRYLQEASMSSSMSVGGAPGPASPDTPDTGPPASGPPSPSTPDPPPSATDPPTTTPTDPGSSPPPKMEKPSQPETPAPSTSEPVVPGPGSTLPPADTTTSPDGPGTTTPAPGPGTTLPPADTTTSPAGPGTTLAPDTTSSPAAGPTTSAAPETTPSLPPDTTSSPAAGPTTSAAPGTTPSLPPDTTSSPAAGPTTSAAPGTTPSLPPDTTSPPAAGPTTSAPGTTPSLPPDTTSSPAAGTTTSAPGTTPSLPPDTTSSPAGPGATTTAPGTTTFPTSSPAPSDPGATLAPTTPGISLNLIDPCTQPMFQEDVPNPLDPEFIFQPDANNRYVVQVCKNMNHETGLVGQDGNKLLTPIYGYGDSGGTCTWPGKTFQVRSFMPTTVRWENNLPLGEDYILTSRSGVSVVDTNIHWAYSLPGYESFTIAENGTPIVTHVHGGHNDSPFDGNPEYFFSPGFVITGPRWESQEYNYDNSHPSTTSWYHDHALGLTRLNVYAGLAGFYIVRDGFDNGLRNNLLGLPAYPYETALAIQDRMFKENGELFYSAFPGDPFYQECIDDEGVTLPVDQFPNGGPTVLPEMFGNVMLVNGKIWPKMDVEPRNYRLRLLNGCDSRFLVVQFFQVDLGVTELPGSADPIPFTVIADSHSLAFQTQTMDTVMIEPGSRIEIVLNFADVQNSRVIMKNIGPDEPFGSEDDFEEGTRDGSFCRTDRIMAFDVTLPLDETVEERFDTSRIQFPMTVPDATRTRSLGLFEGRDLFGRLQPLLGTVRPATDVNGVPVLWPDTEPYQQAGLAGKSMEGTMAWHEPTTENPRLGHTEEWDIWNLGGEEAHPIHLHMVFFEVLGRNEIVWDSSTSADDRVSDEASATADGTYLVNQPLVQHTGDLGQGFRVVNPTVGDSVDTPDWYFENGPKDTIAALPGTVTKIKALFDKPGRFVWHCHNLAHEDHEMMRVFFVSE